MSDHTDEVREVVTVETSRVTTVAPAVVEETTVVRTTEVEPVYRPRGKWDFTDAQRIIIAILLWLNILVLVIAILAVTGRLTA